MGFLGLFGCKPKEANNNLVYNLKPVLDSVALQEIFITDLYLPTGRIIAADPFFIDDRPFQEKVSPGTYPVKLLI